MGGEEAFYEIWGQLENFETHLLLSPPLSRKEAMSVTGNSQSLLCLRGIDQPAKTYQCWTDLNQVDLNQQQCLSGKS